MDDWKAMAGRLPKQPCDDLMQDVMSGIYDYGNDGNLGDSLILFHREAVEISDMTLFSRTMDAEAWAKYDASRKRRWGARCTCLTCGNDFVAGYSKHKSSPGIVIAEGEDGLTYPGYTEPGPESIEVFEDETMICPECGAYGILTHRSKLRSGRTYQVVQAETVSVDGYMVVMFWMVCRHQDDTGGDYTTFLPYMALAVDKAGKLRRFRAIRHSSNVTDVTWGPCKRARDPMQIPYHCYGAMSNRQVGGWCFTYGPELDGTTGEKTALDEYIGKGGAWPGAYLCLWAKHPQVENLMRQDFAAQVQEAIDRYLYECVCYSDLRDAPPISWVDWSQVKPHRMLRMSKEAFRVIRKARWTAKDAEVWDRYRCVFPGADALEYESCRSKVGCGDVGKLLGMVQAGWDDLTPARVVRYLEKQGHLADGVQLLIDYRRIALDMRLGETAEVLWPRDLMAAHDRVVQAWAANANMAYSMGFTTVYMSLRDLEWTDGDLCIVIPRSEQDLVDEGRILRHCVGTYGKTHCSGKPIFFIRHRRRPERSYYTLNIDLTGKLPREIQLHGYGNERHGPNKEYKHTIPQAVRDFADRWQREVLLPWFVDRNKRDKKDFEQSKKSKTA